MFNGKDIKIMLIKRNLTQGDLAKKFGVSKQMISSLLNNTSSSLRLEEALEDWYNDQKVILGIINDVESYIARFGKMPEVLLVTQREKEILKRNPGVKVNFNGEKYNLPLTRVTR